MERTTIRSFALAIISGIVFASVFFATFASVNAQEIPSAKLILEQCDKAHAYCENLRMAVDTTIKSHAGYKKKSSERQTVKCTYLRVGDSIEADGTHLYDGNMSGDSFHFRLLSHGDIWLQTVFNLKTEKKPRSGAAYTKGQDRVGAILDNPWLSTALDGYIPGVGGRRIVRILAENTQLDTPKLDTVGGSSCFVVEGPTRMGYAKVWIDRSAGPNLLRKITLTKTENDIFEKDQSIAKFNEGAPDFAKIRSWTGEVLVSKYEKIGGITVPTQGTLTVNRTLGKGGNGDFASAFVRSKIELAPTVDPARDFQDKLAEDSPIVDYSDRTSGVQYVWQDGKVVPAAGQFDKSAEFVTTKRVVLAVVALLPLGLLLWRFGISTWNSDRRSTGSGR